MKLQQPLPFTVLKLTNIKGNVISFVRVATALTVYGIETPLASKTALTSSTALQQPLPFTVLKLHLNMFAKGNSTGKLQQPLPFTVLKLICHAIIGITEFRL